MSTHPRLALVGLVLLSTVLVGCGEESVEGIGERTTNGEYLGHGPTPPFHDGSEPIRLTLREGGISFTASCNQFYAQASMTGGILRTSSLGGTEVGCPGPRQHEDEWMVDFFGSSPEVEFDGRGLTLRRGSDEVTFVRPDVRSGEPGDEADLMGTRWRLTGIGERDGDAVGMMVVPDDVTATIRFVDDEFTVHDGCNSGSGSADVDGDLIRFGELPVTLLPCRGAAAEVERGVLRVLAGTATWSVSGDELRLGTRDGRHELVFHR